MISLQFLLTALVVVVIPGTGVLYTVAIALGRGQRAGLWAAAGCTAGILPHLAAAILGLAAILHTSAMAFQVVKWAGVAYLLYLAYSALREGGAIDIRPNAAAESGPKTATRGALINILNPKLSVFFLALLPPFLSGAPGAATVEMSLLGAVFMALTLAVFAVYALFAAAARDLLLSRPRVLTWLSRGFAGIFAALAVRLAAERA